MSNDESSVYRCPVCSQSSATPPGPLPLSNPPSFGDGVRFILGGPLMVVVDAVELPSDAPRHASTAVFYLDDCGSLRSERVPWGLLCSSSHSAIDAERVEVQRILEADFYSKEEARMSARIQFLKKAINDSKDPMSFFGSLRAAILSIINNDYEVDHRGSPETVAAEEAYPLTPRSSEFVPDERTPATPEWCPHTHV
jgi:hypothetical protein